MNLHPARWAALYSPSDTATSQDYGLARYQKLTVAPNREAQANQVARLFTLNSQQKLARIRSFEQDWDGNGSAKPSVESVSNAEARLPELYRLSTLDGVWREPHISASEAGEVSFEWWSGSRKVTMYFGEQSIQILRSWGVSIDDEMDLQELTELDSFPMVWAWLYGS